MEQEGVSAMEKIVPDLPWGRIAAVAGALLAIHLTRRGLAALARLASDAIRSRPRSTEVRLTRHG